MTHHVFSDEALKTQLMERHPFRGLGEGKVRLFLHRA